MRYNYAVDGDPLTTTVIDRHGTVKTRSNLLGQTLNYTDVHGVRTEKEYDPMGRVAKEAVVLPNAADAQQVTTFGYDDGRWGDLGGHYGHGTGNVFPPQY